MESPKSNGAQGVFDSFSLLLVSGARKCTGGACQGSDAVALVQLLLSARENNRDVSNGQAISGRN